MPWFAGIDREEIAWYPTIKEDQCVKCGMCMNCGKGVFEWSNEGKPVVAKPYSCVVGCTTCLNLCLGQAIRFQPLDDLRSLYRQRRVWTAVRHQLAQDGKIPASKHEVLEKQR